MELKNKENWIGITSIWFGCIACLPAILIGSTLISSFTLLEAIIVGAIGYSIVLIFLSLLSIKSVKFNLNAVQLAERSFGYTGSKIIVGLIIGIATMVWFGVQTNIAGLSFSKILLNVFDISFSVNWASLFWGLVMVLTAVFGFKYMKWLNYIAVPCILILVAFSLVVVLKDMSFAQIWNHQPVNKMSIIKGVGIIVGLMAVGGVISPDYNRFSKNAKTAVMGSVLGVLPGGVAFLAIGAILGIVKGTHDIVEIFSQIGYPILAMTILILVTWTSNVMNAYSGGLGLNSALHFSNKRRPYTTLFVGLIGTLLGVVGILDKFTEVAIILSAMIPPIAGVVIADYYFIKSKIQKQEKAFRWLGIVSWLLGVSIVFLLESDIKNVLGILVSAVCYYILDSVFNKKEVLVISNNSDAKT